MQRIILASSNPHKLEEIYEIAQNSKVEFDLIPRGFNPNENGKTFEENSFIKAFEAAKLTKQVAIADDTGLCVDALDGRPGINSARYAPTQNEKISKLLNELKKIENRNAHFVCVMSLVNENGKLLHQTKGVIEGKIINERKGLNGFGYDPVFYVKELNKTMAEMSAFEKNTLSHRAKALLPMLDWIETNLK